MPDGNGNPLQSLPGLDDVTVAPIVFSELRIVIKHKFINRVQEVEIALPGNVIGLEYGYFFRQIRLRTTVNDLSGPVIV